MFLSKTLFRSIHFELLLSILSPNALRRYINISTTFAGAASLKFLGRVSGKGCSGCFFFFRRLLGRGGSLSLEER